MNKVYTFEEAIELIRTNKLPEDFNQWTLADENGWTIAHEAAMYNQLPDNFDQWQLTDAYGKTVKDVLNISNEK